MKILFFGDIIGRPGRHAIATILPRWQAAYSPDIIIANGENTAAGMGITHTVADELFGAGINVLTLGNHTFSKKEAEQLLVNEPRIIRPANYPEGVPGFGYGIFKAGNKRLAVINLLGRTFMEPADDPFKVAADLLPLIKSHTNCILFDVHAEATSEKAAIAWHFDGKISAVVGTHTHVQTSDERILPQGTAFITDVGMVGPQDSILGMQKDGVLKKFLTRMPSRFEVAGGNVTINAVVIEVNDETGMALNITRIQEIMKSNITDDGRK
ncbi:MAG: TIGR00282 family metallophosphoesterase [bacterium]